MNPLGVELLLEKLHGHVAVLGVALCFHPPLALRRARAPGRAVRLSAYLATLLVAASIIVGWVVYPEYRLEVRQTLYLTSRMAGRAFEVKEHLGTFALAAVLAGSVVTRVAARPGMGPRMVPAIRRLYLAAGLLAATSAVIGLVLASIAGFDYGAG